MASGVEKDGQMLFLHEKKSGGGGAPKRGSGGYEAKRYKLKVRQWASTVPVSPLQKPRKKNIFSDWSTSRRTGRSRWTSPLPKRWPSTPRRLVWPPTPSFQPSTTMAYFTRNPSSTPTTDWTCSPRWKIRTRAVWKRWARWSTRTVSYLCFDSADP